jgi:hypothetical protein
MRRVSTYVGPPARAALALPFLLIAHSSSAGSASNNPPRSVDQSWALSVFGGPLTEYAFANSFYSPGHFADSYLAGVDGTYTYYSLPSLPLKLELDATAAKRFGQDNQWDFGVVPTFRWTAFPWNKYLYTNFRIGPVGVDYATGVSPWELHWAGNNHGSRFLNYFLVELDFRPSEASPLEVYVGWHHRSGAWGVWNDTYGGSTYEIVGLRYHF